MNRSLCTFPDCDCFLACDDRIARPVRCPEESIDVVSVLIEVGPRDAAEDFVIRLTLSILVVLAAGSFAVLGLYAL